MFWKRLLLGRSLFCALCLGGAARGEKADFSRDILPLLSDKCFRCHGPDAGGRKADLRLDIRAEAVKPNKDGRTPISPQQPDKSEVVSRIFSDDSEELMPPAKMNKPLTTQEKDLIKRWITEGAEWGQHWAFIKPLKPALDPSGQGNAIDALVQRRLAAAELSFSPPAPKTTLIRRVSLDLTGLPPTRAEVEDFLADDSDGAYEKVVDRLLNSPSYGERMAWDWLDAARYADTNGYEHDSERSMYPWRDWVVSAFNKNLPFDQFTVWQLAGDLLPNATHEQKLATAFCRNHAINGEGGRIGEENRVDYVMDMSETAGTTWLGLTLNCCRCHDHKFDPITNKDYYQMFAYFNHTPVDGFGGDPHTAPILGAPPPDEQAKIAAWEKQAGAIREELDAREKVLRAVQSEWEKDLRAKTPANASAWRTSAAARLYSAGKQVLEMLNDGTILASGPNPEEDNYHLFFKVPEGLTRLGSICIEPLPHPTMTAGGLAKSETGNFILAEIQFRILDDLEAEGTILNVASAQASDEQPGFGIAAALDADAKTGWSVDGGKPLHGDFKAVFQLKEATPLKPGQLIKVRMKFEAPQKRHVLGHFRVSFSERTDCALTSKSEAIAELLTKPADQRTLGERMQIEEFHHSQDPVWAKLKEKQAPVLEAIRLATDSGVKVMVMHDLATPRQTRILRQGLYDKPGAEVEPNVPTSLPQPPPDAPKNRLGLAQWMVSPENPLTSRVVVNRFWQQLFGIGLVKTAEDFGVQGERPPNQPLLDWLAVDFRENQWNVKRLIKQIVMSRTYQQSSRISPNMAERDPENRLLARGARYRMPSWMLRDQALAASGLLVRKMGGRAVRPYQPEGVWEEATFGLTKYVQDHGENLYRRSLYTFWRRIVAPTMFFDNASRQTCTVKVFRTNTPLQALMTLNDTTFVEASRALAQSALQRKITPSAERVAGVFRAVLVRAPSPEELGVLQSALDRHLAEFQANPAAAEAVLKLGELPVESSLPAAELAAWTQLCLTIFNLDEAVTRE